MRNSVVIEAERAFGRRQEQREVAAAVMRVRARMARKATLRRIGRAAGMFLLGVVFAVTFAGVMWLLLDWLAT